MTAIEGDSLAGLHIGRHCRKADREILNVAGHQTPIDEAHHFLAANQAVFSRQNDQAGQHHVVEQRAVHRPHCGLDLLHGQPTGIEAANDRAGAGADDEIGFQARFVEHAQHADMGKPACRSAGQRQRPPCFAGNLRRHRHRLRHALYLYRGRESGAPGQHHNNHCHHNFTEHAGLPEPDQLHTALFDRFWRLPASGSRRCFTLSRNSRIAIWRGVRSIFGPNAAPVLEFGFSKMRLTFLLQEG